MSLISNLNEPTGYQEGAAKQCKPNFQDIYELKGFLEFEIIRGNKTYNELLELIEKEKADGSK